MGKRFRFLERLAYLLEVVCGEHSPPPAVAIGSSIGRIGHHTIGGADRRHADRLQSGYALHRETQGRQGG